MRLHRLLSYSIMTVGTVASVQAVLKRWQWDETNIHAAIMLDWDDVQAVATRVLGQETCQVEGLLGQYKEAGATHLSIPELTLRRLLDRGDLNLTQGPDASRVYMRAQRADLAEWLTTELAARLAHLHPRRSRAKNPLISFVGDLPTVAEVGLGFDPAQAELARRVGLSPVARPIGYSWVQPEMIDRTLEQAAALGVKIVAFQGTLIPGHEFKIQATVEAMRRHRLSYAYFRESRHQKGDWFLAKNLTPEGLVVLAHEFEPQEMLEEDWHTISYRWVNLAMETGVRLCSVRFFRILHAGDPLESLAYIRELAQALKTAEFVLGNHPGHIDLTPYLLRRKPGTLAWAGLSTAGAAGLFVDLLPVPDQFKLAGLGVATLALTGLPFLERTGMAPGHHHDHEHYHDHGDFHHEHSRHHDHHHHDQASMTAYAPKGLALAATLTFPAATAVLKNLNPVTALAHTLAVSVAGATAITVTTAESDYLLGIEEYRGYNLDWLLPLGLASVQYLLPGNSKFTPQDSNREFWRWLPLAGVVLVLVKNLAGKDFPADPLAALDREHRHAHTHHLSAFQRLVGDVKMLLSARPLRKWSFLAPFGAVVAVLRPGGDREELVTAALTATTAGQVAILSGFRNGQRPLFKTLEERARVWAIGALLALLFWFFTRLLGRNS